MHKQGGIIWLDEAVSTNDEARRLISGLDNLSMIAARAQSGGRGQGDHIWHSEPGKNLTFSLVLRFDTASGINRNGSTSDKLTKLNEYVTSSISGYLKEHGIDCWVKPPNDIWCEDRKIAGILIENILDGQDLTGSIIGIGLNVNQTEWPPVLPNPVSMAEKTGRSYILENELRRLSEIFFTQGEYAKLF